MSDVDTTPTTPVTIGDRMGWWRGDISARLDALQGAGENNTLEGISTAVGQMSSDVRSSVTGLGNSLEAIALTLTEMQSSIQALQQAVGAAPYDSLTLTTVRGLLNAVRLEGRLYGVKPDLGGSDISSTSTLALNGSRWIVWPAADGYSRDATNRVLTPSAGWAGWSVYIQTGASEATVYEGDGSSYSSIAVNSWVTLDSHGSAALSWSVPSSFETTGILRPAPATNYFEFSSETLYGAQRIHWPNSEPFFTPKSDTELDTAVNNFTGWTLEVVAATSDVLWVYGNPAIGGNPSLTLSLGAPTVFTGSGAYVWTWCSAAFTLRLTPP